MANSNGYDIEFLDFSLAEPGLSGYCNSWVKVELNGIEVELKGLCQWDRKMQCDIYKEGKYVGMVECPDPVKLGIVCTRKNLFQALAKELEGQLKHGRELLSGRMLG